MNIGLTLFDDAFGAKNISLTLFDGTIGTRGLEELFEGLFYSEFIVGFVSIQPRNSEEKSPSKNSSGMSWRELALKKHFSLLENIYSIG